MGANEALRLRTKTEQSECYMPMSPALQAELIAYLASRTDDSEYLFPGRSATSKYVRTVTDRMKEAVQKLGATAGASRCANTQNSTLIKLAMDGLIARRARENHGGRSRT
jgi:hypothetical protein